MGRRCHFPHLTVTSQGAGKGGGQDDELVNSNEQREERNIRETYGYSGDSYKVYI